MVRYIAVILFFLQALACSEWYNQEQLPDITITIDSLITNDKCAEAVVLIDSLLVTTNNDSLIAELHNRYGACKANLGEENLGVYFHKLAANFWRQQSHRFQLMSSLKAIGDIYTAKKNYAEAGRCFLDALNNCTDKTDSVNVLNSICILYINQEVYDSVHFYIDHFLTKYEKEITPTESYYISFGKGLCFYAKRDFDSALIYLQEALKRSPRDSERANTFTNIANVYKVKRNFPKAMAYLDSSGLLCQGRQWYENEQFDFDTYREVYDSIGDFKRAYHYSKLYRIVSDTLYNRENKNAMVDANAAAKTIDERHKTEKAETESRERQQLLIFTLVALGLVASLAFIAFRNTRIKQKANQLLTQQKLQVQQLADQLAVANDAKARLFSTIGHDLRSPVSSLYASLKMQELKGNAAGNEMSEQTVRLLDTLEELLVWSKSQMDGFIVQPVKINVRYFFEDLRKFYTAAATAKHITVCNEAALETIIRTDENLLKTIFRNAIGNAIANTANGSSIQLTAQPIGNDTICMYVINPCDETSFQQFKNSFDEAVVKSGAYGLGVVLIKEFAQKLDAIIHLSYTGGNASLGLCISTVQF